MKKGPIDFISTITGSRIEHEGGPGAWIAAIYPLFSGNTKCFDMILNYSTGVPDFHP